MDSHYVNQVRLLLSVLPDIAGENVFALKGGTAINLFYRNMPRLSVDIDLTYLPMRSWNAAQKSIDETLERIVVSIMDRNPTLAARRILGGGAGNTRAVVSDGHSEIKIETSPVMRGTVVRPTTMTASDAVIERFGFAEANVVSFEDLYAGKLSAALARQHPRDLFDVMLLYENEGITDELFRVFLAYVASSRRPMHEILAPIPRFENAQFEKEFAGMTAEPVTKETLLATQVRLHEDVGVRLTGDVAAFLLSLHDAKPDFGLIGLPNANELPAIQWKVLNLKKLKEQNPKKHMVQRKTLESMFI